MLDYLALVVFNLWAYPIRAWHRRFGCGTGRVCWACNEELEW